MGGIETVSGEMEAWEVLGLLKGDMEAWEY